MLIQLAISAVLATTLQSPPDYVFPRGLPAAVSEDSCASHRCVWDARHEGQSMILTRWAGGYVAFPISHRRAHRLIAAYCERPTVECGY